MKIKTSVETIRHKLHDKHDSTESSKLRNLSAASEKQKTSTTTDKGV